MAIIKSINKENADPIIHDIYNHFESNGQKTPEWVLVMAQRPEILKNFFSLFNSIMGDGEIEKKLKWKIGYVVSQTLKCEFCVDVTSKMMKKMGMEGDLDMDEEDSTLLLVKDITLDGHLDSPELLDKLRKEFNEPQIVEIISVIGLFNYINRFNNTLAILPE